MKMYIFNNKREELITLLARQIKAVINVSKILEYRSTLYICLL